MPLSEKKKFPFVWVIGLILLAGILVVALCDFAPKQETVETTIQHSID